MNNKEENSMTRFYGFFGGNRASVAMDVRGKKITLAFAFCNKRDNFVKDTARNILNGRLNARIDPKHTKLVRQTLAFTYKGDYPKRDLMNKIMDDLRDLPKDRTHAQVAEAFENITEEVFQKAEVGLCNA
jgi:hypothetical protein